MFYDLFGVPDRYWFVVVFYVVLPGGVVCCYLFCVYFLGVWFVCFCFVRLGFH